MDGQDRINAAAAAEERRINAVGQIEVLLRKSPPVPKNTDKFFTRLSRAIMVHTNPLGPFDFTCDDVLFDEVVANFDKVLRKETQSRGFAMECLTTFVTKGDTGSNLDSLRELKQCLKLSEIGGRAGAAVAVNVFKLQTIFGFLYNSYTKELANFLGDFVKYIRDPNDPAFEGLQTDHPLIHGILSSVADITTARNMIWVVQDLLERYCYVAAAAAPSAAAADAAAAAAAAAVGPVADAPLAPPNLEEMHAVFTGRFQDMVLPVVNFGKRFVRGLLKPAIFSCAGCVSDFGSQVELLGDYIDVNAAHALYLCIENLKKYPSDDFEMTIASIFAKHKFLNCVDLLGVDPIALRMAYNNFRSDCQQGLFLLTRKTTDNDEQAIVKIQSALPFAFEGCLTVQSLRMHEEHNEDSRSRKSSISESYNDTQEGKISDEDALQIFADMRKLDLEFMQEWTYVGSMADSALDIARYLAYSLIQPGIERAAVAMRCEETAAKPNFLITDPAHLKKISSMLPAPGLFMEASKSMCTKMREKLTTDFTQLYGDLQGVNIKQLIDSVCTSCENVVNNAFLRRCQYDIKDGKVVVNVAPGAEKVEDVSKHYQQMKAQDEALEQAQLPFTQRGLNLLAREGYSLTQNLFRSCVSWISQKIQTAPAAEAGSLQASPLVTAASNAGAAGSAEKVSRISAGGGNDVAIVPPVPIELMMVIPPASVFKSACDDIGQAPAKKPANADDEYGGGRSRSRKRSASKRTRRKGKQPSKKLKRKSRRYVRRASSRKGRK